MKNICELLNRTNIYNPCLLFLYFKFKLTSKITSDVRETNISQNNGNLKVRASLKPFNTIVL